MATRSSDEHERSAAGLDYDDHAGLREGAAALGAKMIENGPGAILDEIENLLPEEWRDHIRAFPHAAVALGVGVGVWLGMKKKPGRGEGSSGLSFDQIKTTEIKGP